MSGKVVPPSHVHMKASFSPCFFLTRFLNLWAGNRLDRRHLPAQPLSFCCSLPDRGMKTVIGTPEGKVFVGGSDMVLCPLAFSPFYVILNTLHRTAFPHGQQGQLFVIFTKTLPSLHSILRAGSASSGLCVLMPAPTCL